jgi:TonB family protein
MRPHVKAAARHTSVAVLAIVLAHAAAAAAQSSEAVITPVEWPRPVYPQIAQSARVSGDVEVAVDVRPDGTVASVQVMSGPPLLSPAVEDAVRRVRFECRHCSEALNRYSLYVTFRLSDGEQSPQVAPLVVSPTQGWVTVVMPGVEPELYINTRRRLVRGIKCAYLWRCQPEAERARAANCLWLWPCGPYHAYL